MAIAQRRRLRAVGTLVTGALVVGALAAIPSPANAAGGPTPADVAITSTTAGGNNVTVAWAIGGISAVTKVEVSNVVGGANLCTVTKPSTGTVAKNCSFPFTVGQPLQVSVLGYGGTFGNATGNPVQSAQITVGGPMPAAPTGVVATAPTLVNNYYQSTVTFASAASSSDGAGVTGYTVSAFPGQVCYATKNSSGVPIVPLSCTLTGLTPATNYTITAKENTLSGSGDSSAPFTVITPGVPGPVAQFSLTSDTPGTPIIAGIGGNGSITATWGAPPIGWNTITSYTATATPASGPAQSCTSTGDPGNYDYTPLTCKITGLVNGTSYTLSVIGTNPAGAGPSSEGILPVTPATVPGSPTGLKFTRTGSTSGLVSWNAPSNNGGSAITGYTVATSSVAGCSAAATPTSCTVTGLKTSKNLPLYFTVRAYNAKGGGADAPAKGPISLSSSSSSRKFTKSAKRKALKKLAVSAQRMSR